MIHLSCIVAFRDIWKESSDQLSQILAQSYYISRYITQNILYEIHLQKKIKNPKHFGRSLLLRQMRLSMF